MLTIKNLTKAMGGRTLFREANLTVNWGERVALVGPNGAGKSTLFKIILDEEPMDEGTVDRDEYAIMGFLAQEAGDPTDETVLEIAMGIDDEMVSILRAIREGESSGKLDTPEFAKAQDRFNELNGYALEPKAKKILAGLGFKQEDFEKPAREFSGGWVMRAHIARLLVMEPDLLMMDEPTNHLDLMSLLWFQRYLSNYPGAILMISHDRDFMDGLVEQVVEIDPEAMELVSYTGNYSSYQKQRKERYEQKMQAWRNHKKEMDRVQEFIDRFRNVGSKASQVQDRMKQLDKMKDKMQKPRAPRKVFKFNFPEPPRPNQKLVELEKVKQAYGDKVIYDGLDLVLEKGEKIVLVGPNGAGKSTLLKIIAGHLDLAGGERKIGYLTKMGYFSQHRVDSLNEDNTVLDEVMGANTTLAEDEVRAVLGSFLFRRADVDKRVRVLSGGEKSRLNLVKFLVDPPNLLLMDEPTTHLDINSIDALVQGLKNYTGTLVFISHDVHFIRSLAETTLHVNNGTLTRYAGGYDYFLEKSGLDDDRAAVTAE
ncbi:ABC-F family ATP-binding cassette domain-containing protein [Roseibacillus ishigakijimensis]|uniref:ABC-F family ATP-binding cassette domain-containing protein n=1 Tax=Roseibacillus ishigakijimensis TaxID=454146 RepID=A0A934VMH0_9BACT|nr:ABC-F family ATP-binding cassette domain-containing protein [Roseibacillus ishigakijimensis]MBK1833945.1 ABC-F family ATP-binding cassette domain-containing protein [Roseibacillus ishigakijimensis]